MRIPKSQLSEVVDTGGAGLRVDGFLAGRRACFPSKKSAYKAVKRGEVAINGLLVRDPHRRLERGDTVTVSPDSRPPPPCLPIAMPVAYEDDVLAVVVKPPGLPVSGNFPRTVLRALPYNLRESQADDRLPTPQPVHRLDGPTGGLLAVAKTAGALVDLSRQFETREVRKVYRAVAAGTLPDSFVADTPVDGREARTDFTVLARAPSLNYGELSLVECRPLSGRTHQIRRHLAAAGAPVVGDGKYGVPGRVLKGKGLFLWAVRLTFCHPSTGRWLTATTPLPAKFASLLARETRRSQALTKVAGRDCGIESLR